MNAPLPRLEMNALEKDFAREGESSSEAHAMDGGTEPLVVLDRFHRMLAVAETLDEVAAIRNRAEAVRSWVKSAALGLELQNRAAELKLRAERKAGKLLANLKLRGGDRKSNHGEDRLKLADLGISQNQSKRWQKEAAIPEDDFQCYVRSASQLGEEVTTAGLLRVCRRADLAAVSRGKPTGRRGDTLPELSPNTGPARSGKGKCDDDDSARILHSEFPELAELVDEIKNHHALLLSLLEPLYEGRQESLLPGQRKGIRHYMSEVGHLLNRLVPNEAEKQT